MESGSERTFVIVVLETAEEQRMSDAVMQFANHHKHLHIFTQI